MYKWNGHTPFTKGHKIRVGMKHPKSFIEGRKGNGNPAWKGDDVSLSGLHTWINRNFGRKKECEHCHTTKAKIYDWSNKDHKYRRQRKDWQRLCRKCHIAYDKKFNGYKQSRHTILKVHKTTRSSVRAVSKKKVG